MENKYEKFNLILSIIGLIGSFVFALFEKQTIALIALVLGLICFYGWIQFKGFTGRKKWGLLLLGGAVLLMGTSAYILFGSLEPELAQKKDSTINSSTVSIKDTTTSSKESSVKTHYTQNQLPDSWQPIVDFSVHNQIKIADTGHLTIDFRFQNKSISGKVLSETSGKEITTFNLYESNGVPTVESLNLDLAADTYSIVLTENQTYQEKEQEEKMEWKATFVSFESNEKEPNNDMESAIVLKNGNEISANFTQEDELDYYKFLAENAGTLKVTTTMYMGAVDFALLDQDGKEIKTNNFYDSEASMKEPKTEELMFDLEAGTYYVRYKKKDTGKYEIKLDFTISNSVLKTKNDTLEKSLEVNSGDTKNMFFSMQDDCHYFKITAAQSGKLKVRVSANFQSMELEIINAADKLTVKKENLYLNGSEKEVKSEELEYDLDAGTYYIKCKRNSSSTGNYEIAINWL